MVVGLRAGMLSHEIERGIRPCSAKQSYFRYCNSAPRVAEQGRGLPPAIPFESLNAAKQKEAIFRQPLFVWRRERDSNPRYILRYTHAFQACPFSHSGISPRPDWLESLHATSAKQVSASGAQACRRPSSQNSKQSIRRLADSLV